MHHVCKPKRMLTGLLAVVLAGFIVQSAVAFTVDQNSSALAVSAETTSAKTPLVIPYLSHGVGAEQGLYTGSLSHAADAEQSFNGTSTAQPSDVFTRAVDRHEAFIKAMNATAAKSSVRPDNRAGTLGIGAAVSHSQPTAVRPDDRVGFRGIGTISASQSAGSSSGTDWNSVLMAGGALLGVLLIVAAAVAVSRRQHARALAH